MLEANLYEILQVQPTADSPIIQSGYRRLILRYHPDRNAGVDAQEMTQRLNRADEILSDPEQRAAYEREFSTRTGEGTHQETSESFSGPPPSRGTKPATRNSGRPPPRVWLAGTGVSTVAAPKTVAERLGHASVTITLDLDSHCLPSVQETAAVQFGTAMEQAKTPSTKLTSVQLG